MSGGWSRCLRSVRSGGRAVGDSALEMVPEEVIRAALGSVSREALDNQLGMRQERVGDLGTTMGRTAHGRKFGCEVDSSGGFVDRTNQSCHEGKP